MSTEKDQRAALALSLITLSSAQYQDLSGPLDRPGAARVPLGPRNSGLGGVLDRSLISS